MKRLYNTDILIVTLLTIFCLIAVITSQLNNNYIKIIVEYLIILFLPGYSILTILFPKKNDLKIKKRLALSFILSIAITLLIAITWNYISIETSLTSILISISLFTLIIQPISFLRRIQVSERFNLGLTEFKSFKSSFKAKSQRDKTISIVLVIFIVLVVSMTAYIILSPKEDGKYTEFYLLGPDGKAYNYPTNLTAGQKGTVYQGIVNHEGSTTTYNLIIKLNNKSLKNENITLLNNEKKEIPFSFTASSGNMQKLEFLLYKLPDDKNVYRYLFLQIDVN